MEWATGKCCWDLRASSLFLLVKKSRPEGGRLAKWGEPPTGPGEAFRAGRESSGVKPLSSWLLDLWWVMGKGVKELSAPEEVLDEGLARDGDSRSEAELDRALSAWWGVRLEDLKIQRLMENKIPNQI